MANRPSAVDLAYYSYILAIASAAVLVLTFIIGMIDALGFLTKIVWLTLPISAIGLTLALLARSEFKRRDPGVEWIQKMRIGLRINGLALIFMVMAVLLNTAIALIPSLAR